MPTKTINKKIVTKKATVKTVAKKADKKTVTKKPVSKKVNNPKYLVYSDNQHSFWVKNGEVLNSLTALYQALASMEDAVFAHHVTKDKHDFSDWVDSVLCDADCAKDLRKAKSPDKACMVVAKHLKKYSI